MSGMAVPLHLLACPHCRGPLSPAADGLVCGSCARDFQVKDGLIDLLDDPTKRTTLEEADYDARAGYDAQAIRRIGEEWRDVLERAGAPPAGQTVLEIGAGTGALTTALLKHAAVGALCAADVSAAFLRVALARAEGDGRLAAIRCDANHLPFLAGSFDLVLGRSILHHLLDWRLVLDQCRHLLRPGGRAVFFEPVLEGKIHIALLAAQIAALARARGDTGLAEAELLRVDRMVRHITKASWYSQDREALARLEDKYIFDIPGMCAAGMAAGFAEVTFLAPPRPDPTSLWPQLVATMRLLGIAPAKLADYAPLGEGYQRSLGQFPTFRHPPMGYFVFTAPGRS